MKTTNKAIRLSMNQSSEVYPLYVHAENNYTSIIERSELVEIGPLSDLVSYMGVNSTTNIQTTLDKSTNQFFTQLWGQFNSIKEHHRFVLPLSEKCKEFQD